MTRILYSASMSVDGYIAGPGGDMSWLSGYLGPDPVVDELVPRVTAILSGRRTFDGDDPNAGDSEHEGAFEGQWHGPQIVITHRPPAQAPPDTTFATDFDSAISLAREAAGPDGVVNVLGADVARQCLERDVLDEVLIFIVPVLLGRGTKLLEGTRRAYSLERIRESVSPASAALWFRLKPAA